MIILDWITKNLSTILIALGIFLICLAIVLKMIRDKKKGKSGCGCGCSGCAMSGMCHLQGTARSEQMPNTKPKSQQ